MELELGKDLPALKRFVNQNTINLYAQAANDFNPIHINDNFARNTPLGGTIAHGMLILAYVSEMMTNTFGRDWLVGGKLDVRFKMPARPGDIISVYGEISKLEKQDGRTLVHCQVTCENQRDELLISGETKVAVTT